MQQRKSRLDGWLGWFGDVRENVLLRSAAWMCGAIACAYALTTAVVEIRTVNSDVVWGDLWGYVDMIAAFFAGNFHAASIFAVHNGETHPIVLKLLLLGLAKYDHLNFVHLEYAGVVSCALTVLVLFFATRELFHKRPWPFAAALSCTLFVTFSLAQWDNFILPENIVFFTMVTFSACALVLMNRHIAKAPLGRLSWSLAGAIIFSELALASIDGGVVVWGVAVCQVLLTRPLRSLRISYDLFLYVLIGALSLYAYVHGFRTANAGIGSVNLISLLAFLLVGAGNSVVAASAQPPPVAEDMLVGCVLYALYVAAGLSYTRLSAAKKRVTLIPISLILLGVGESVLIGLARSGLGARAAASSPYATLTIPAVIGLILFIFGGSLKVKVSWIAAVFVCCSMCALAIASDRQELQLAGARSEYYGTIKQILRGDGGNDARALAADTNEQVATGRRLLREYHLSLYSASHYGGSTALVFPPGVVPYADSATAEAQGIYGSTQSARCCFLSQKARLVMLKPHGSTIAVLNVWVPGTVPFRAHGTILHFDMAGAKLSSPRLGPGRHSVSLAIPHSAWAKTEIGLTISSSETYVPKDLGINNDSRTLGVILRSVEFR